MTEGWGGGDLTPTEHEAREQRWAAEEAGATSMTEDWLVDTCPVCGKGPGHADDCATMEDVMELREKIALVLANIARAEVGWHGEITEMGDSPETGTYWRAADAILAIPELKEALARDDEGGAWLPPGERAKLQREHNATLRARLDKFSPPRQD